MFQPPQRVVRGGPSGLDENSHPQQNPVKPAAKVKAISQPYIPPSAMVENHLPDLPYSMDLMVETRSINKVGMKVVVQAQQLISFKALESLENDWDERRIAMERIRAIAIALKRKNEGDTGVKCPAGVSSFGFCSAIERINSNLVLQLKDLRSSIVKEVSGTTRRISRCLIGGTGLFVYGRCSAVPGQLRWI